MALVISGANSYVQFASTGLTSAGVTPRSLFCWVKGTDTSGAGRNMFAQGSGVGMRITPNSTTPINVRRFDRSGNVSIAPPTAWTPYLYSDSGDNSFTGERLRVGGTSYPLGNDGSGNTDGNDTWIIGNPSGTPYAALFAAFALYDFFVDETTHASLIASLVAGNLPSALSPAPVVFGRLFDATTLGIGSATITSGNITWDTGDEPTFIVPGGGLVIPATMRDLRRNSALHNM